jgi:transcriptional regulator with XRE-family HTH domain
MMQEMNGAELRPTLARRVSTILRASRIDADVSQEKLAASLGWTRNTIANIEGSRRAVGFIDFVLIALGAAHRARETPAKSLAMVIRHLSP